MQNDLAQAFVGAVWCDVVPRSVACPGLSADVLLHAGPPYRGAPPAPVVNAAVQAALYEGLAADEAEALRRLRLGEITLLPAQDHGIVTPLAQVVSASMPLAIVRHHAQTACGALLEGSAPALRFGIADPACRARLRILDEQFRPALAACVRATPVALDDVIRRGVAAGEDCHSRTAVANEALVAQISGLDARAATWLRAVPAFVLPVLMAAAAAAVRHHANDIVALGGNGVDFGVRGRGESRWRQVPATAPLAASPGRAAGAALPAIGDSVLVDYCGLGGQVDDPALRRALLDPRSGVLDPVRIAEAADGRGAPAFNLAILDAAGESGLIGRGVYRPPAGLFLPDPTRNQP